MTTDLTEKVVITGGSTGLATGELLARFLEDCRAKGRSPNTIKNYAYLKHFVEDFPEQPPLDSGQIEAWLKKRGESFEVGHRGDNLKRLQSFYDFLWRIEAVKSSPIPAAPIGRPKLPPKPKRPIGRPRKDTQAELHRKLALAGENVDKVVEGGYESSQSGSPPGLASAPMVPSRYPQSPRYSWKPELYNTSDIVSEFLGSLKVRGRSQHTLVNYKHCLSLFAAKYPRPLPMSLEAIEGFLSQFPSTSDELKRLYHAILRGFYFWIAKRKNYPPAKLEFRDITPSREKKVRRSLSNDQVMQLLQLDLPPRDKLIIETCLGSGVRIGELRGITPESVQNGVLTVKGKSGERNIEINPLLEKKLKAAAAPGQLIFHSYQSGKPLDQSMYYLIIKDALSRIGVKDNKVGPHRLRHTYGRLYLEHGGDLESLRQQLGHTDISTTAIYSELSKEQVRKRAMAADPLSHAQEQLILNLEVNHGQVQQSTRDQ